VGRAGVAAELDEIWIHIARESGSADTATRVVESIIRAVLGCWPGIHASGDDVTMICALVCSVYPRTSTS
jgi:hypothetical protein